LQLPSRWGSTLLRFLDLTGWPADVFDLFPILPPLIRPSGAHVYVCRLPAVRSLFCQQNLLRSAFAPSPSFCPALFIDQPESVACQYPRFSLWRHHLSPLILYFFSFFCGYYFRGSGPRLEGRLHSFHFYRVFRSQLSSPPSPINAFPFPPEAPWLFLVPR